MSTKKTIILILLLTCFTAFAFAEAKLFTGKDWLNLSKKARVKMVSSYIKDIKRNDGVTVAKEPVFYCKKMDTFYAKNPNLLKEPAGKILKTLIIMEYDWKIKGMDSDAIAKSWLGDKLYIENKNRLAAKK